MKILALHKLLRICLVVLFLSVTPEDVQSETKNSVDTYKLLNLFGDVFERVRAEYVEVPTDEKLIEAAITGILSSLDPHSSYMNESRYKEMRVNTKGEFGGLGIQVTMEEGFIKVISPIDDTPAYRAGIQAGDIITHLDGTIVQGMVLQEAVEKMRGKIGAEIELIIRRKGIAEPIKVAITRDVIKITSVRSRLENKVGYLRITSFTEQTHEGLKQAIQKFKDELGDEIRGIILDLRNNPGGLLDQAIKVTDAFLDKGEIVSTRQRDLKDTKRYNAREGDLVNGKPIIVLLNGGSASASEIVAGALQDHRRALIMGTRSFGKGSVQTIMPLPGHGAMRLTTARYYTPSGKSIQGQGIDVDIKVEQIRIGSVEQKNASREADLKGALKNENTERDESGGKGVKEISEPKPQPTESSANKDYQLSRALDMLRGISLFDARN